MWVGVGGVWVGMGGWESERERGGGGRTDKHLGWLESGLYVLTSEPSTQVYILILEHSIQDWPLGLKVV